MRTRTACKQGVACCCSTCWDNMRQCLDMSWLPISSWNSSNFSVFWDQSGISSWGKRNNVEFQHRLRWKPCYSLAESDQFEWHVVTFCDQALPDFKNFKANWQRRAVLINVRKLGRHQVSDPSFCFLKWIHFAQHHLWSSGQLMHCWCKFQLMSTPQCAKDTKFWTGKFKFRGSFPYKPTVD